MFLGLHSSRARGHERYVEGYLANTGRVEEMSKGVKEFTQSKLGAR